MGWVIRFLILFASWGMLMLTPYNNVDYFRTLCIFVFGISYDFFSMVSRKWHDGNTSQKVILVIFSISALFWCAIAVGGFAGFVGLPKPYNRFVFFAGTDIMWHWSRAITSIFMVSLVALAGLERMLNASSEESNASEGAVA